MKIPRILHRTTNHAKPRFQLYQPGFNASNGCWLEGRWVTVKPSSKAEWRRMSASHQKLYATTRDDAKKCHYRSPPVPKDKMTPAQKQAWEFYSGQKLLGSRYASGEIGHVSVGMVGDRVDDPSLRWLKKHGFAILRSVQEHGEIIDQTVFVPEAYLDPQTETVDLWMEIRSANRARRNALNDAMVELAAEDSQGDPSKGVPECSPGELAGRMAVYSVYQAAKDIVRWETHPSSRRDDTLEDLTKTYVELRAKVERALGPERFEKAYESVRESSNYCARENLDNSNGGLFEFVVPVFHADGTHEPVGPKDYPWKVEHGVQG